MKNCILAGYALAAATAFGQVAGASLGQNSAQVVLSPLSQVEEFLVETAPGEQQWVSEEGKRQLRLAGINFIDITEYQDAYDNLDTTAVVTFPNETSHSKAVKPMLAKLKKKNMENNLEHFSSFFTRYYKSKTGAESSRWLLSKVNETLAEAGALDHGAFVKAFPHPWGQSSIIATIPGKSNRTIVIGAHQDSTNWIAPTLLAAPGADDDGSGTVTILEALRVLLKFDEVRKGEAENTIEFQWYSAEEAGLLGSQAIFQSYKADNRDVKAMLQQDMTGYVQGTIDAGKPVSLGVITDFVDTGLSQFVRKIVDKYCDIPFVETKCGYACSDHASASKAGYPSAFVIESEFANSNTQRIHTTDDLLKYLSFDHMLEHAKLTLAYAYELAFADFS